MQSVSASEFFSLSKSYPVIDVRTPAEFEHGHIPGAINIPLFTNEDRVEIGTLYKQQGKEAAMLKGMEVAGPRFVEYIQKAKEVAIGNTLLVHCWRGGMRSAGMAWLFEWYGFKVYTLEKGYKAFRTLVLETFAKPYDLHILGGRTGSGKTLILHELEKLNENILDLEKIACHKGSAFGTLGENPAPTQEMFENECAVKLMHLPNDKPIWVEDESQNIGKRIIPNPLWVQMRRAPVYYVDLPLEKRVDYLIQEYGKFTKEELIASIEKIRKRLGFQNAKATIEAINAGDLKTACEMSLVYYDKSYMHGVAKRLPETIHLVTCSELAPENIAIEIIAIAINKK
ncbi:MAG TPA: tRNA 2-selenouridine(34) synthase MnmH [Bacteroidia bacterium]|jgi:tRNA 2-selenouridine synthase|nr:tRNA 2-selenouridine(34) synthase MnmH [Bacteroidia bacterium]